VLAGFSGFETWDETYVHTAHGADRTILQERDGEPYTWLRKEGAGRVFYTAYGHDHRTWKQPGFHDLLARGIRYAVGEAAAKELDALGLTPARYVDSPQSPVPNYEKRDPAPRLQEPFSPAEAAKRIQVPVDLQLALFASEKDGLWNVIDLKFDERGRLWTCESLDYPNELKPQGQGRDRIRILEVGPDGRLGKATVFADKLSIPGSLVFARGGIIVVAQPDTLFLRDTNGDDRADERQVLFTGWGAGDTHAGPSNLRYGFDGWIWGTCGYSGFNGQVGGETVKFGQGVFRFRPDGSKLELISKTSNNTWGLGFTEQFDILGSTANNQHAWYVPIPLRYYQQAGLDMGNATGIEDRASKRLAITREYVRMVDVFQQTETGLTWGFTAAAAQTVYTARAFPREYWGRAAFVAEPTGHLLTRGWLEKEGTHFTWTRGWNLAASDDEWFAPVAAEIGPDGAVWLSDFYSFLIQHNPTPSPSRGGFAATNGRGNAFVSDLRDTAHARLWRIAAKATPRRPTVLEARNVPGLIAALKDDVMNTRLHAQRLLVERGQKDIAPQLAALVGDPTLDATGLSPGAQHAVWTLAGLGALDAATQAKALAHPAAGVRRAALATQPPTPALIAALRDPEPLVRLSALLALADAPPDEAAGQALYALSQEPAVQRDRWLPTALQIAAGRHAAGFLPAALAAAPALAPTPTASVNLLTQGDFTRADQWQPQTYAGRAEFAIVPKGRGGGPCAEITSREGADASWQLRVPLEPNRDYLLSAWVKTEGLRGATGALLEIHALHGEQPKSQALQGTQDWTQVSFRIQSRNQREILLNCLFGGWGRSTGTAWWDDVSIVDLGPSSGVGPGGGLDLPAIARAFAKTASPAQLASLNTTLAAHPSALARSLAESLRPPGGAAATAGDDLAALARTHQVVKIKSIEGMKYDVMTFTVKAGQPIALAFSNGDLLQHNLIVVKPGTLDPCCQAADAQVADPTAIQRAYVPKVPDILAASKLLNPGESEVLRLPAFAPGDYPYLCTFPGHCHIMRGIMKVVP
jgi:putative membrane-bound dehydrogenase-like protein